MDINSGNKDIDLAVEEIEEKITIRDNSESSNLEMPAMVQYVTDLSNGALSPRQATYILLLVVVVFFGIAGYLVFKQTGIEDKLPVIVPVEGPNFRK